MAAAHRTERLILAVMGIGFLLVGGFLAIQLTGGTIPMAGRATAGLVVASVVPMLLGILCLYLAVTGRL